MKALRLILASLGLCVCSLAQAQVNALQASWAGSIPGAAGWFTLSGQCDITVTGANLTATFTGLSCTKDGSAQSVTCGLAVNNINHTISTSSSAATLSATNYTPNTNVTVWIQTPSYVGVYHQESNNWHGYTKWVKMTVPANNTDFPVTYRVLVDGTEFRSFVQAPHAGAIITQVLVASATNPSPVVTLAAQVTGLTYADNQWGIVEGAVTDIPASKGGGPVSLNVGSDPDAMTPQTIAPPTIPMTNPNTSATAGNIAWNTSTSGETNKDATAPLSNSVFREGVAQLVAAGSSAGSGTDMTATNGKLDTIAGKLEDLKTKEDATNAKQDATNAKLDKQNTLVDKHTAADEGRKTSSEIQSGAESRQIEAKAVIDNLEGVEGDSVSISTPSGGSIWDVTIGSGASATTFHLGPGSDSNVSALAEFSRAVLEWVFLVAYGWWCWNEMDRLIATMATIPQARGNPIFGGTGAQIPALFAAMAITTAIFLVVPTLWAVATTADVTALWHPNWFQGATSGISGGIELFFTFVPVQFLLNLGAHMFVFRKTALGICIGVFSFIKVMVP